MNLPPKKLIDFIRISPGFKAAVNLKNDRNDLEKVAGFIPTEVAREVILDMAQKLHPDSNLRSRIVMGTYGTGKSHLALVLLNFLTHDLAMPELQTVIEKLDDETKNILLAYRKNIPGKFLIVNLYGEEGDIADSLMKGLRHALEEEGLRELLPNSAFDAALARIDEIEKEYPDNFVILKQEIEKKGMSVDELKTRLREYQRKAFDIFRMIHPAFSAGGRFEYTTLLSPQDFYESVVQELIKFHGYAGIAIFWDEFGHKMGEIVKDPSGREGLILQEFAEYCNSSGQTQVHFYLFCHRSLKEYHDIFSRTYGDYSQHLEDDLRKIEGRFKQFIMKSTDVETFQLIDSVIIADTNSNSWKKLINDYEPYFNSLINETAKLKYFTGFTNDELRNTVVFGAYPLHPLTVYSLPAISEKVAQNNRTLFTCLCEDETGSFYRFLKRACLNWESKIPPMFTIDSLWDYFANDVKQQERTYAIYRDFEKLKTKLDSEDTLGLRILKAVSVFCVTNPARLKVTEDVLAYALDIPEKERESFKDILAHHSDLKNENHILIKLQADGSYRLAVSSATESIIEKIKKILKDSPEKLGQSPIQHLKSIWPSLQVPDKVEATSYEDEYGVKRSLILEPVSLNQLKDRLHILTKNIGSGKYIDGMFFIALCSNVHEIREAQKIAIDVLIEEKKYDQVVLAIPKEPVQLIELLKEHQALKYLKDNEASLYGEGGELYDEWKVWNDDKFTEIHNKITELLAPEKQMLDYFWKGQQESISNNRQLKKLASKVMYSVFPDCPVIGEPKLTLDDFTGNWGYRTNCRDVVIKLTKRDAPEQLWNETAAATQHVITQVFKANGLLKKNKAGEYVIEKPDPETHRGAHNTWECIEKYISNSRKRPIEMKNLVRTLRKPPFGVKCRVLPLFFAAVAHNELCLGNISFEFQRNAQSIETIAVLEPDTLEKIFSTPEKYKLTYVNVSSNQRALINGLAKVFDITFSAADPPLERVKKTGETIGEWWRSLPKHAQITDNLSEEADTLRQHIFCPLAELEPNIQQILLRDTFEYVFETGTKISQKKVEEAINPIKKEFEGLLYKLKNKIVREYSAVFGDEESPQEAIAAWFRSLASETKNFIYSSEPAILIDNIRKHEEELTNEVLLEIAEKLVGLPVASWNDDMVVKFGAKLDSAKKIIENFHPDKAPSNSYGYRKTHPATRPDQSPLKIIIFVDGKEHERILEPPKELSDIGRALENMLNSTIEQLSKGLDESEKIDVLFRAVKKHVFGI